MCEYTNKQIYCRKTQILTLQKKITYLLKRYKPFLNLKKSFSGKKHYNTKLPSNSKRKKVQIHTYIFIYKSLSIHD